MARTIIPKKTFDITQTATSGITILNSNITNLENASTRRAGNLIIATLIFTVSTAITNDQEPLFSGFPPAIGYTRFRCPSGTDGTKPDLVLSISTDGIIRNQWSTGGIGVGQWQCQFMYFTN